MSKKKEKASTHSSKEKFFAPFGFLLGIPTNPHAIPFKITVPEGLAHVCSATNPAEADFIRQMLQNAGFHVEHVPAVTTVFGTSGNAHVFVHAGEEKEAREFLSQLQKTVAEEQNKENEN